MSLAYRLTVFLIFIAWSAMVAWYASQSWANRHLCVVGGAIWAGLVAWYTYVMDMSDKRLERELSGKDKGRHGER